MNQRYKNKSYTSTVTIGLPHEGLSPKRTQKLFGNHMQPALIVIPLYMQITLYLTSSINRFVLLLPVANPMA